MWGRTETSRPDTADVPALGFGYLAVRNQVPHALLSGRANQMGTWVLHGRSSLTRRPRILAGVKKCLPAASRCGRGGSQLLSHTKLLSLAPGGGPTHRPGPSLLYHFPPLLPPPNLLNSQETGTMAPRCSDFRGKSSFLDSLENSLFKVAQMTKSVTGQTA